MTQQPQWQGDGSNAPWGGQQPPSQGYGNQGGSGGYPPQGNQGYPGQGYPQQGQGYPPQGGQQGYGGGGQPPGGYGGGGQPPGYGGGTPPPPPEKGGPSRMAIISIVSALVIAGAGLAAFLLWPKDEPAAKTTPTPTRTTEAPETESEEPEGSETPTEELTTEEETEQQSEEATEPQSEDPSEDASEDAEDFAKRFPVGSCVKVQGTSDDPDLMNVDCNADATDGVPFEIVETHSGTAECGEYFVKYTEYFGSVTTITVCLGEVLQVGQCYETTQDVSGLKLVTCPEGSFKVEEIVPQAQGTCSAGEPFSYDEWNRTYCLAQPS